MIRVKMAACPPKVVEEKGPCKIRTKSQSSNAIQSHNDSEIKPNNPDDGESCKKAGLVENKDEHEVSSEGNLLSALSVGEFEDLLQEVSKPSLFVKSNCATTHPVVKQLVDGKVIDVKELEDDLNWSSLKSSRFKENRSRRLRYDLHGIDGNGHGIVRGGVGCGVGGSGGSAASRTMEGGSLQNLHHGKSSSSDGKKLSSSLHKSGSLNTFPNSSSYESDFELAALKSFIATNVPPIVNNNNNNNKSMPLTSATKRNRVQNYGSTTCCSAVNTTVNNINRTCNVDNSESHNSDGLTDFNLTASLTPISAVSALAAASDDCLNDYSELNDKEAVAMMEIDSPTADLNGGQSAEGEKLSCLMKTTNNSSSTITNTTTAVFANGIEERVIEEVDAKVAMPLLHQVKQCPRTDLASNYNDERRTAPNSIVAVLNEKSIEAHSNQGRRDLTCSIPSALFDTNGNQIQHSTFSTTSSYGSINRPSSVSVCGGLGGSLDGEGNLAVASTDGSGKARKKSKLNSKQKLIEPEKIEGYFGCLDVEVILKRINSTDGEESTKMGADGKSKKTGNKSKNKAIMAASGASSKKDLKKNNENEVIKVNGLKEEMKGCLENSKKKSEECGTGGGSTGSGSQSPELVESLDDKFTVELIADTKSILNLQEQLNSSFVCDFYSAADAQVLVEDSEFHEVKKKKKKKQQQQQRLVFGSCGGGGGTGSYHNRYQRSDDVVVVENGRNSSSGWMTSGGGRRGLLYSSDDSAVRRKSTSSISPMDHSDNSDGESVHSLPAASTTKKPTVAKTSSSSSCTPQASYADIAKMTSNNNLENSNRLTSSLSFTTGSELVSESVLAGLADEVVVSTVTTTTAGSRVMPCQLSELRGVEFVGGFEWPEEPIEVTFGFEVNQQLLQMTESELMSSSTSHFPSNNNNHHHHLLPALRNTIYTFPNLDHHSFNRQLVEYQSLIIANPSPPPPPSSSSSLPSSLVDDGLIEPDDKEDVEPVVVTKSFVPIKSETIYTKTPTIHHQSNVNFIRTDWLKVSEEFQRGHKGRIRYYTKE
ncbi:hypothetical protein CHUAL_005858 [Chamberlinius hualienensis]